MLSNELEGFATWVSWNADAVDRAPEQPGVYVFRRMAGYGISVRRIVGESDIIYIGGTPRKGTLQSRLRNHLKPRADEKDAGCQIDRVQKEVGPLEVAWKTFEMTCDAATCESTLLYRYAKDHIELPPLNNQIPQRGTRQAERWLQGCPVEEICKWLAQLPPDTLAKVKEILAERIAPSN